jgi:predicted dehydrogenase
MGSLPPTPSIRWGIVGAGMISSWFASDLTLDRASAPVTHIIGAIGSSSISKGEAFVSKYIPSTHPKPAIYDNYAAVYNDPNVDIVYIGTPHSFHKQNCLDAIAAGKNVLCEKPFTLNAREAEAVLAAAKEKGVFIMEAMWTRFHPLMAELRKTLFEVKAIGDVRRTFCDFGLDIKIRELGEDSRLKRRELGAGSLLDIGIYSLTWGLCTLEREMAGEETEVKAVQSLVEGVDVATSMLLLFKDSGRMGILTSSLEAKSDESFCRIEGTEGSILVRGVAASAPKGFTVFPKVDGSQKGDVSELVEEQKTRREHRFEFDGMGFHFEADAVAMDVLAGRKENATMPHSETLRVMKIMDMVRRQGGASFPQDDE